MSSRNMSPNMKAGREFSKSVDKLFKKKKRKKKGGCYIATAVYGSYDCPEVWTLRRYRDKILCKKWYGNAFVHLYYTISPMIVKSFGKTSFFNKIFKNRLDRFVKKLNNEGIENTQYEDVPF